MDVDALMRMEQRSAARSAALWTATSVVMALIAVSPAFSLAGGIWVATHAVLCVAALLLAVLARNEAPDWFRFRPAQLLVLLSALDWGLGSALLAGSRNFELMLPFVISVSGLACAAVWLYRRDLWLLTGIAFCLLVPALVQLLAGREASWATAAILGLLVIVNLLIGQREDAGTAAAAEPVIITRLAKPAEPDPVQAADAEERYQNSRVAQELKAELERHRAIEEELKKAKQDAEAANMAKGEFLATMSHEIRTPLNGIIPLLEILKDTKLQPDQREYVNTAYSSAKSLLSIIDDILDYSKIEANKLELETVGLNLREVVESVMRLMKNPAESKGLSISMQIDPNVRLAGRGDPVRLRQVLTNLVSNAVKFTEKGSVQIQVTRKSDSRTHQELLFSIKDTGIGLSDEQQSRLFKPFSQADTSTTRTFGGTGLGLVICRRIVDLMGGKIGVKSELGRGSVFWFSAPMLKAVGDISHASGRKDLSGARVLMVSNDARFTQRLTAQLSSWGMQLAQTNTTADAAGKLKSAAAMGEAWAYDLAIVDLGTLRATAPAFMRSLGREPALERLRFIYIEGDETAPPELKDERRAVILNRAYGESELLGSANRLLEVDSGSSTRVSLLEEAKKFGLGEEDGPAAAPVEQEVPTRLGGHVLLVEDNPVNRQVAQRLIGVLGLSMELAENGKEALEKIRNTKFDLVLMDCQMPIMDGYTATRSRRMMEADRNLPHLPIVAMTANAMVGDREKCLAAGMDDYMSKPLNRGLLAQTLKKWLPADARSRPSGAAAPAPSPAPTPSVGVAPVDSRLADLGGGFGELPPGLLDLAASIPGPPVSAPTPITTAGLDFDALFAPEPAGSPGPAPFVAPEPVVPQARSPMIEAAAPVYPPAETPAYPPAPAPAPVMPALAAPAAESSIDRAMFDEVLEVMGSDFESLVSVYLDDTPKHLRLLAEKAKLGDIQAMIAPSHSLKSTSANLGAHRLSDIARQIEQGARTQELRNPIPLVQALIAEYQRAARELRSIMDQRR